MGMARRRRTCPSHRTLMLLTLQTALASSKLRGAVQLKEWFSLVQCMYVCLCAGSPLARHNMTFANQIFFKIVVWLCGWMADYRLVLFSLAHEDVPRKTNVHYVCHVML